MSEGIVLELIFLQITGPVSAVCHQEYGGIPMSQETSTANAVNDLSGKVTGGKVTGGKVTGGKVTGGKVTGGKVTGGKVTGGKVTGGNVTGGKVPEGKVPEGSVAWVMTKVNEVTRKILAESPDLVNVDILDVCIYPCYGHLNLSLVIRCTPFSVIDNFIMMVRTAIATAGLTLTARRVPEAHVMQEQTLIMQQQRFTITWHAERMTGKLLATLTQVLAEYGVEVVSSRRLTPLGLEPCWVEYRVVAQALDFDRLQQELASVAQRLGIDLALQRGDVQHHTKRLAVFDMDSTLIKAEVIDALALRAGVGDAVAAITERAMRGEIDFRESFRDRMALLKGLSISVLSEVAESLPIMDGAATLVATLKAHGIKTAIVSGGFLYFAEHVQRILGIDQVFANTLEVRDGVLTGVPVEPVIDAQKKVELVRQLAADGGWDMSQVVAVGDGANDVPMLNAVGMGIAFRAKPLVRASTRLALSASGLEGVLFLMGLHHHEHIREAGCS